VGIFHTEGCKQKRGVHQDEALTWGRRQKYLPEHEHCEPRGRTRSIKTAEDPGEEGSNKERRRSESA